ncbi:MAG: hypothetical protein GY835_00880 [bacterium]|nr:hypothetical protein [bacterium]
MKRLACLMSLLMLLILISSCAQRNEEVFVATTMAEALDHIAGTTGLVVVDFKIDG